MNEGLVLFPPWPRQTLTDVDRPGPLTQRQRHDRTRNLARMWRTQQLGMGLWFPLHRRPFCQIVNWQQTESLLSAPHLLCPPEQRCRSTSSWPGAVSPGGCSGSDAGPEPSDTLSSEVSSMCLSFQSQSQILKQKHEHNKNNFSNPQRDVMILFDVIFIVIQRRIIPVMTCWHLFSCIYFVMAQFCSYTHIVL